MRRNSTVFGVAVLVAIAGALVYLAVSIQRASSEEVCGVCSRPLHGQSRAVGFVENRRETFCCPTCALTAHRQSGEPARITELTDYETDSPLDPAGAYLVRGSNVNQCMRDRRLVDATKQSYAMEYDRCSPSFIAFARKEAAEDFATRHGGTVLRFNEFAAALR